MRAFARLHWVRSSMNAYLNSLKQLHKWVADVFLKSMAPRPRLRLAFETMEDRIVPSGSTLPDPVIFVGTGIGQSPLVNEYNAQTGALNFSESVYNPSFLGGVRVATADLNGDGFPDVVVAPGPGTAPIIHVLDGKTGAQFSGPLGSIQAFSNGMTNGVYVAAADITGTGTNDVIAATETINGPEIKVFSGTTGAVIADFTVAGSGFSSNFSITAADFGGDGKADIVVGAGSSSEVRVFNPFTGQVIAGPLGDFFPFGSGFSSGVTVAADSQAGDVSGDGIPDLVVGTGPGATDQVKVFSGTDGSLVKTITPFGPYADNGVRVGLAEVNDGSIADIVVGTRILNKDIVGVFSGITGQQLPAPMGVYHPFEDVSPGIFVAAGTDPYGPTLSYDLAPTHLVVGEDTEAILRVKGQVH